MSNESPDRVDNQIDPPRITDVTAPSGAPDGAAEGNPIAGVEIDEAEKDRAVEPDDNAREVDGPTQSHT